MKMKKRDNVEMTWLMVFGSCVFPARGTVSLPPEGRHVYRPRDGMFTARGAVSNESAGKSDGDKGKSDGDKGKNVAVR